MNPVMSPDTQNVPESLVRYLDGETPKALHRCQVRGCPGFAMGNSSFCPRCAEELDALAADASRRAGYNAEAAHLNAMLNKTRRSWSLWHGLMDWTPSDHAMARFAAALKFFDSAIKAAVILTMIYLACEIGLAFLPGGPVQQILGGGK
jgi:hypothetical protein